MEINKCQNCYFDIFWIFSKFSEFSKYCLLNFKLIYVKIIIFQDNRSYSMKVYAFILRNHVCSLKYSLFTKIGKKFYSVWINKIS